MQGASEPTAEPRVANYIRWSTEEQSEGTTLEVQKERCSLFVRSQGWTLDEQLIFIDDGYSGGTLNRPALTRLRAVVKAGHVDIVVAYSIDRLSRNLADITELIQREWSGRCAFRSASQPISSEEGNPTGQLIFNILASFAEFERGLIKERTHSGLVRRTKEGKYPGGPVAPYGYVRAGVGTLAIDSIGADGSLQGTALITRQIFAMAIAGPLGQGPALIARTLNDLGVPAPAGGKWWAWSIRELLRNPVYAGTAVYGRRKVNPGHQRDKSIPIRSQRNAPLAQKEGAIPAIVSKQLWERVQANEAARRQTYAKKGIQAQNRALLTGLLHCPCGGPLHTLYKQGVRYYRCSRNAQAGGSCPHRPGIHRAKALETLIVTQVMQRYGTDSLGDAILMRLEDKRAVQQKLGELQAALGQIEQRARAVAAELGKLRQATRKSQITLGTYEELKVDATAELADLHQKRLDIEASIELRRRGAAVFGPCRELLAGVDLWNILERHQQRELLMGLIRGIVLFRARGSTGPTEVTITWEDSREPADASSSTPSWHS